MAKAGVALQGIGPFILAMAGQSFPSANDDGGCCNDVVAKVNKTQKEKKRKKKSTEGVVRCLGFKLKGKMR